jgi:hypothetical protein
MRYLNDKDRRALRLAKDLQTAIQQWLSHRGVDQAVAISPFIDSTGQPAVIIKMNARVACVMIDSLNEQRIRSSDQPTPRQPPVQPT